MENKTIPVITEGLNEVIRPDIIGDGQVVKSDNYYTETVGRITLRTEPSLHPYPLPAWLTPIAIWTWVPNFYPTGHYLPPNGINYVLLTYNGISLHLLILDETTQEWVNVLAGMDAIFDDMGMPRIAETTYGIAICDGRENNKVKYINISQYGEVRYADIGLPAPLSMAIQNTHSDNYNYVDDDSMDPGMNIPEGSILYMAYTMVTEDGAESNPSPIVVETYLNNQRRGTEFENIGVWQRTLFQALRTYMADVDSDELLAEKIKYFNIYMSSILFTEGIFTRSEFRLARRISIANLLGDNNYVSTSPFTGKEISYDNDVGSAADDVCHAGGVTFLANANSIIKFPFDFEYYFEIKISNQNSRNFVNGAFWIRLQYSELIDRDGNPIILNNADLKNNFIDEHRLRIYDYDRTTPLPVIYHPNITDAFVDILIKIPYIASQSEHIIYLVCGGAGVIVPAFRTTRYGHWRDIGTEWAEQECVYPRRVLNHNVELCVSCEEHEVDTAYNRANLDNNLDFALMPCYWDTVNLVYLRIFEIFYGLELVHFSTDNENAIYVENSTGGDGYAASSQVYGKPIPESGYVVFAHKIKTVAALDDERNVFEIRTSDNDYIKIMRKVLFADPTMTEWWIRTRSGGGAVHDTAVVTITNIDPDSTQPYTVFFSWDSKTEVAHIALRNSTGFYVADDLILDKDKFPKTSDYVYRMRPYYDAALDTGTFYAQIIAEANVYINQQKNIEQIMSHLPYFPEEWIGYDEDEAENVNVIVEKGKEIEYTSRLGLLRYSSLGSMSFPDINVVPLESAIMRIIPAPNYLHNGEYLNSILIFGVNGERKRFLLRGDQGNWHGQINDLLVAEQSAYGLLSRNAIKMVGETIYWLSPAGLLKENIDGIANLSKDRVALPNWEMKDVTLTFNPILNMILLHDGLPYEKGTFSIMIIPRSISLCAIGSDEQLTVVTSPPELASLVEWESAHPAIISVDPDGLAEYVSDGITQITAFIPGTHLSDSIIAYAGDSVPIVEPDGAGTEGNPHLVSEPGHLRWIAADDLEVPSPAMSVRLAAHYKQTADIDMINSKCWYWDGAKYLGFRPIGRAVSIVSPNTGVFTGYYNGNNFKIESLYINRPSTNYIGLFAHINNYKAVKNVLLVNANIVGNTYVGGICGTSFIGLDNCRTRNIYIVGNTYVGGVGGILVPPLHYYARVIESCSSTGVVIGNQHVGGLAGHSMYPGWSNRGSCFAKCWSACAVYGESNVGGFVGRYVVTAGAGGSTASAFNDCYAIGNVTRTGAGDDTKFGSFAGSIYVDSAGTSITLRFRQCYGTGLVDAGDFTGGGFVGEVYIGTVLANWVEFINCYFDIDTTGQLTTAGSSRGDPSTRYALGKTTIEMTMYPYHHTVYVGWDFDSIWSPDEDKKLNNGYPYLRNNLPQ